MKECYIIEETEEDKKARIEKEERARIEEEASKIVVKVPIKEELKRGLIFGLKARPPIGIILSFLGYSYEVFELMQTLSHRTRAFIFNAQGLNGF